MAIRRPKRPRALPLDEDLILSWADAHFERTGAWPRQKSGPIPECPGENWRKVDNALNYGLRGLLLGSSLALLLQERRGKFNPLNQPNYTIDQILSWADAHFERVAEWPGQTSGPMPECPGENWRKVDHALTLGLRGLRPGSSLAQLLQDKRGVFNTNNQPKLTIDQILEWADLYKMRHGKYPACSAGAIDGAPNESWARIDEALRIGNRGFSGGSSLATILSDHRGRRHKGHLPRYNEDQILSWADEHYARTDRWPVATSGPVYGVPYEKWGTICSALRAGRRGLPGGSSLAQLLAKHRGKRNHLELPDLSIEKITIWLEAHLLRHGKYPSAHFGPVDDVPNETWRSIDAALRMGFRGLPGGSSLAKLLTAKRYKRDRFDRPEFCLVQITAWVQAYTVCHGKYPTINSGRIADAPDETWRRVDSALKYGYRGLQAGSSLAKLKQNLIEHNIIKEVREPE